MTKSIDIRDSNAKAQFDEAARRLESAEARVRALSGNPLADDTARQMALDAYEEARLLWLSCEAVLRSATIVDVPPPHAGKNIVICGGNAHVRESIALLLRLRGFRTTVISKSRIDEAISHGPAVAVVVDIERDPDHACMLAVNTLEIYPGTRVVGMIPATLEHYDWKGFDVILVKPVSTDRIVQVVTGESRP